MKFIGQKIIPLFLKKVTRNIFGKKSGKSKQPDKVFRISKVGNKNNQKFYGVKYETSRPR